MTDTQPAVLTDKERTNRVIDSLHDLAWAMCHPQAGEAESEQFSGAVRLLCDEQAALRAQVEQLTAKLSDTDTFCGEYHGVCCGDCGAIMTIMRPGKYQCNACDYWSVTIHDALGTQSYDEGWHDPIETLKQRVKQLTKERDEARRQAETNRRTMVELAKGDPEAAEVVLCRIADKLDEWPEKVEMAVEALIDLRADDANKIEQLAAQIERLTQQRDEMAATIDRTEKEKA